MRGGHACTGVREGPARGGCRARTGGGGACTGVGEGENAQGGQRGRALPKGRLGELGTSDTDPPLGTMRPFLGGDVRLWSRNRNRLAEARAWPQSLVRPAAVGDTAFQVSALNVNRC